MITQPELHRLADSIANLTTTINEIINEQIHRALPAAAQANPSVKPPAVVLAPQDPFLTKPQLAAYFQVTVRTIDDWMARGYLPYYKIGRAVRFRLNEVRGHWEATMRCRSPGAHS